MMFKNSKNNFKTTEARVIVRERRVPLVISNTF